MDAKLNKWLRYGVRFNVIESKLMNINEEADSGYGTMFSAISSQPTAPIYTEDGEYFDGFLNTRANPVAIVDLLDKATLKSRFVGSAYIEIEPIKNLKLRSDNGGELVFYKVNTLKRTPYLSHLFSLASILYRTVSLLKDEFLIVPF